MPPPAAPQVCLRGCPLPTQLVVRGEYRPTCVNGVLAISTSSVPAHTYEQPDPRPPQMPLITSVPQKKKVRFTLPEVQPNNPRDATEVAREVSRRRFAVVEKPKSAEDLVIYLRALKDT